MKGAVMVAVVLAVLTVGATEAIAAPPDGQLKQLAGLDGCLHSTNVANCRDIPGAMGDLGEPAITANGRFVYIPDAASNAVYAFSRDDSTGALTFLACRSFAAVQGCQALPGVTPLQDAMGVAVHENGSLYVVGGRAGTAGEQDAADGIAHFTLGADGVPTFDTCLSITVAQGSSCLLLPTPMLNPVAVDVSPDGEGVYVAAPNVHVVQAFKRNSASGTLTNAGCLSRLLNCPPPQAIYLASPRDVEVTPDGKQVLVASPNFINIDPMNPVPNLGVNVSVYDRNDPATGVLTVHDGSQAGACVSWFPTQGCNFLQTLRPTQLAVSPDGTQVYAVSADQLNRIVRAPATGEIVGDANWCAFQTGPIGLCTPASVLTGTADVALSPNGVDLYTAGERIGVWDRAANNTATPKAAEAGCLAPAGVAGCRELVAGTAVKWILPSPEPQARHVYAFAADRIFSFAVDHAPRCSGQTFDTPHNMAVTIQIQCSDADGDPLEYVIASQPVRGALGIGALQSGTVTYGPLLGTSGEDSFQVRAIAAQLATDPVTIAVRVAAAPLAIVDADADGSPATADCNDANPRVRPGAREIPGNAVDENCDKRRALGRLGTLRNKWSSFTDHTDVTQLRMTGTPAGARGQIRCDGDDCVFRRKAVRRRGRVIDFLRALEPAERSFEPGQTIEVRVTAPNYLGKVVRYRIRARAVPGGKTLCLPPGATRPRKRC